MLNKNIQKQIIILVFVLVLIIAAVSWWTLSQKPKPPQNGAVEEVFNLSAKVLTINQENHFLIVKPVDGSEEVKVILSATTKFMKLKLPVFDPENPPEGSLTPERTEIELSDFQEGDYVFIETNHNIAGKSEFNDVKFIHILP